MADFCLQCSLEVWGEDSKDLAGITTPDDWAQGKAAVVVCEGCGPIQVDPEGRCINVDCAEKHGVSYAREDVERKKNPITDKESTRVRLDVERETFYQATGIRVW